MSFRFNKQRLRIRVNTDVKTGNGAFENRIDGGTLNFARGYALQVEVALFWQGDVVDIAAVTAAQLDLRSTADPNSPLAMSKIIQVAQMNKALTKAAWDLGNEVDSHFIFSFLSTETPDSVFGYPVPQNTSQHWLTFWGFTDDNGLDADLFAASTISSFDAGATTGSAPPPVAAGGASILQVSALIAGLLPRVGAAGDTWTAISPDGNKRAIFGVDNNGNPYEQGQPDS